VVGLSHESANIQAKHHSCNDGRCKKGVFCDGSRRKLREARPAALEQLEAADGREQGEPANKESAAEQDALTSFVASSLPHHSR